ncbi:MAG: tetratricopeptide repeat protein [Bacteroidia bacterium]
MKTVKTFIAAALFFNCSFAQTDNAVSAFSKSYDSEKKLDYEGAIEAIKSLSTYESNMRLGYLYGKIGFNRTSISYYENAAMQNSNSAEARTAITYPANTLGNTDKIIEQYNKILSNEPYNITANYNLGTIYYYKNDFKQALTYFDKTLIAYPFNYDALLMAAWCNTKLEKNAEAEVLFNKVLLYSPLDKSAWEGMTLLKADATKEEKLRKAFGASYELAALQNYTGALAALKPVYDKSSYEINLRMGFLCSAAGMNKEAVNYLNIAIALKPNSIEPRLAIATPLAAMGNMNDLITNYNSITGLDPQNTTANYRLGYIQFELKEYGKAITFFEKVVNLYPSGYDALIMLAKSNLNAGNNAVAKGLFTKILLLYPGNKAAAEGLASVKQ